MPLGHKLHKLISYWNVKYFFVEFLKGYHPLDNPREWDRQKRRREKKRKRKGKRTLNEIEKQSTRKAKGS